jgi:hypothetical protein
LELESGVASFSISPPALAISAIDRFIGINLCCSSCKPDGAFASQPLAGTANAETPSVTMESSANRMSAAPNSGGILIRESVRTIGRSK